MSYLVLARKYRPSAFSEVVGQEHVTRTLGNAFATGRVHHAFLFCGPRGCGKTTLARIVGKALNCQAQRPPDDDGLQSIVLRRQPFDLGDHLIQSGLASNGQRCQRTRERARRVADRQADAAATHVDAENPHTEML